MTAYGKSITQKEILIDFCVLIPRVKDDLGKFTCLNSVNPDWNLENSKNCTLNFKEFHVSYYNLNLENLKKNSLSSKSDFIIMQFVFSGSSTYDLKDNTCISINSTEHNIVFLPKNTTINNVFDGQALEFVNIYLEKDFLLKYIPENHSFINKINDKSFSSLASDNLSISPKVKSVLLDIINCGFDGHLKKLYTQAKIIELLTLQLVQFEEEKKATVLLKQSDIDKMMLVKEIITSNFKESFTLSYLAREAGTNEQYLKKNFKILFGSTVFNYMLACKMEKAKELLVQGEYKIAEVAELIGYKHATHFTSAFKKFFGYNPQQIKGK